jgi:OmpA-OmpF porin, OOP family
MVLLLSGPAWPAPSPKSSDIKPSTFSITPLAGGFLAAQGASVRLFPSYGFKLSYDFNGKTIADSLGVEATFNYLKQPSGAQDSGYLFRLDALYPFTPGKKWVPFLAVGLGVNEIQHSNAGISPLFNYGLGVKYYMEDWLALRVDARHVIVYHDINTENDGELTVGLTYIFGKERKKKTPPPKLPTGPAVPGLDDGQKLPEKSPEAAPPAAAASPVAPAAPAAQPLPAAPALPSPNPSAVIPVPSAAPALPSAPMPPLPAAAPAPSVKRPAKTVRSSVKVLKPVEAPKPAAPAAPAVDPLAPLDSDLLANPNQAGKGRGLQGTPEPPVPPQAATPADSPVETLTVEFEVNKSFVNPGYHAALKALAAKMQSNGKLAMLIQGHTDSTGGLTFNFKLSKARAESVKRLLVKYGVPAKRIATEGHGPLKPISDNVTQAGRQRNRNAVVISTYLPRK